MALIGYARVSTYDQHLHLQQDALRDAGCSKIYTDMVTGSAAERQGLEAALEYARTGDTLVVWRLDRLGRSLKHLISTWSESPGSGDRPVTGATLVPVAGRDRAARERRWLQGS